MSDEIDETDETSVDQFVRFGVALCRLINEHGIDAATNTSDLVLSAMITAQLQLHQEAMQMSQTAANAIKLDE